MARWVSRVFEPALFHSLFVVAFATVTKMLWATLDHRTGSTYWETATPKGNGSIHGECLELAS